VPLAACGWEVGPGLALGGLFPEADMAAVDLLVQLSGCGGGGDEGVLLRACTGCMVLHR